ncbi:MAG: AAA family ATPase [Clostridia bacterium]|nr:AAA family ATPase [Clostridia bacterium]
MAKIVTFISGKGGSGKSTVLVGIANELALAGKRVLIVDTDVGLNCLDVITGVGEGVVFNWGDIFNDTCEIADAIYPSLNIENLFILPAPKDYKKSFHPHILKDLLRLISSNFDFILIDAPAGLGKNLTLALEPANEAVLVVNDDNLSLNAGKKAAEICQSMGISITLIINAFRTFAVQTGLLPSVDDAMEVTEVGLLGIVPFEANLNFNASQGLPYLRDTRATEAFARIAKRLQGEKVDLPEQWR